MSFFKLYLLSSKNITSILTDAFFLFKPPFYTLYKMTVVAAVHL